MQQSRKGWADWSAVNISKKFVWNFSIYKHKNNGDVCAYYSRGIGLWKYRHCSHVCISWFFECPKNFFFTLLYWYAAYTPPPSKINAWLPPCLIRRSAMDLSISDVEKWMGSMLGEHKKVRCYFLSLRVISFLMLYTPHKNLLFHQIECLKRCGEQGRLICYYWQ